MRRLAIGLSLLALALAGCGGAEVADSTDTGAPLAQPSTTTTAASSSSHAAEPAKSERGLLVKKLGEIAVITDPDNNDAPLVRFAIEAITVDVKCTAEFASPAENGHLIAVRMNVETTPEYDPQKAPFHPDALQFSVQGPDGFTDGNLGTAATYGCLNQQEQLPLGDFGPAGKYIGTVVLDSKYTSGILMFKPYVVAPGGWEWVFPA